MKRFYFLAAIALTTAFTACDKDDDNEPKPVPEPPVTRAYILNSGNWGMNDASITLFDKNSHTATDYDVYQAANGEGLGDVAQDMIAYGSKLYCTVTESSKLVVMDKDLKQIKAIPFFDNGVPTQPRCLAADGGFVYTTTYDGCITKVDTATLEIVDKVAVGDHPEGLSFANGKLYANISGYGTYGDFKSGSVAVVDAKTFKKIKDIKVNCNPYTQSKVGADGNVYMVSTGNYAGSPGMAQEDWVLGTVFQINTKTDTAKEINYGTYIALYENYLYVLYSEYYLPQLSHAFVYDLNTGMKTDWIDLEKLAAPNSIDVDPYTGLIYVSDTPWGSYGKVHVFDHSGKELYSFDAGYYTCKIVFDRL